MSDRMAPYLSAFAALLDAQPEPVRAAFNYCLALVMVEAGKARLVETQPGEAGTICVFESVAGQRFSLARPSMSDEEILERLLALNLEQAAGEESGSSMPSRGGV
jgi:hypothetical protein